MIPLAQYFAWYTLHISYISRVTIYSLVILLFQLEPVHCSICGSNCRFLTCIEVSQEAVKVVWYFHVLKNFPKFVVIHTVKGFGVVIEAKVDDFMEFSSFFDDPVNVGKYIFAFDLSFL